MTSREHKPVERLASRAYRVTAKVLVALTVLFAILVWWAIQYGSPEMRSAVGTLFGAVAGTLYFLIVYSLVFVARFPALAALLSFALFAAFSWAVVRASKRFFEGA